MITKEKFYKYRKVQIEGKYNMFTRKALKESGLSTEDYFDILENYGKYFKEYYDDNEEAKFNQR